MGAALRPAFAADTPGHVTAAACDVCSAWLGSGVARDPADLRRVYQLLVASLDKLRPKASPLYNESALTLEKLSILKAWAEVYIVCMKGEMGGGGGPGTEQATQSNQPIEHEEDEFGDFETTTAPQVSSAKAKGGGGGNLATLVQEELPSLSKHWLAALRDHALLSLPAEFKPQLPREGGAFYSNETLESARPHYRSTWPPLLAAAAVWLSHGQGFDNVVSGDAEKSAGSTTDVEGADNLGLGPANAAAAKGADEINGDRFFLLFGICMEALSHARSADMTREETAACLRALRALLDHPWARREALAAHPVLLVELCNVLHRTVLTRDHPATHLMTVDVLRLVLRASGERTEAERKRRRRQLELPANSSSDEATQHPELDLLGEGGESGELESRSSVVFATLEVCLCVLVRHYPELSDRAASLHSVAAMQAKSKRGREGGAGFHLMSEDQRQLVSATLNALASLPALCSPAGALTALPSILWLLTGVLRAEASSPSPSSDNLVVSTALHGLKAVAASKYARDERSRQRWSELLQSALLRVLDLAKTAPENTASGEEAEDWPSTGLSSSGRPDEMTLLMTVAVFVLYCPPEVVCPSHVQYPAMNVFTRCFHQSADASSRLRAVQTMESIFQRGERRVAVPYIHGLAPRIFQFLAEEGDCKVATEAHLALTLECGRAVEVLMSLLPEADKKAQVLTFLLPVLVGQLLGGEEELRDSPAPRVRLHETALASLTRLGQALPAEFRSLLASKPELKARLEAAALASRARAQSAKDAAAAAAAAEQQRRAQEHRPTIKLSMDFSKFSSSANKQ